MKTSKLITALLLAGSALQLYAGSKELAAAMRKQQRAAESSLAQLWLTNQRGKQMEQILGEYVVREVRLRAIMGTAETGSLLGAVLKQGQAGRSNPQAFVQAMVLQYYLRRGIDIAGERFVKGPYLIRKGSLTRKMRTPKSSERKRN